MAGNETYPDPTTHPGVKPFIDGLVKSGHDPLHRMVFADWLQERGYENAANGQRWAAKRNLKPQAHRDSSPTGDTYHSGGWTPMYYRQHAAGNGLPHWMFSRPADERLVQPGELERHRAGVRLSTRLFESEPLEPGEHEENLLGVLHHYKFDDETGEPIKPDFSTLGARQVH